MNCYHSWCSGGGGGGSYGSGGVGGGVGSGGGGGCKKLKLSEVIIQWQHIWCYADWPPSSYSLVFATVAGK